MRGPELSPRLRMVGELVPEGARLADVGNTVRRIISAASSRSSPRSEERRVGKECAA